MSKQVIFLNAGLFSKYTHMICPCWPFCSPKYLHRSSLDFIKQCELNRPIRPCKCQAPLWSDTRLKISSEQWLISGPHFHWMSMLKASSDLCNDAINQVGPGTFYRYLLVLAESSRWIKCWKILHHSVPDTILFDGKNVDATCQSLSYVRVQC